MPTRYLKNMEESTKYYPQIYQIVQDKANKFFKKENVDLSTVKVSSVQLIINDLLADLSLGLFLQDHRNRYQQEQKERYYNSLKKFNSKLYTNSYRNKTLENLVTEYNSFVNCEIKKSHWNLSPKIEANYRRNYHDGETSPVTSLIFYLYFQSSKLKRSMASILAAAYRNPYSDRQQRII